MLTGMQIEIGLAILFVLLLALYLWLRREHIVLQKIFFPIVYICMLRRTWGVKLMHDVGTKHREFVKIFGYTGIGVGFIGMILMVVLFGIMLVQMFTRPDVAQVAPVLPFMTFPGLGFLSFTHWLLALVFIVIVHEFAHGMVAVAHGIKIKSSGIAIIGLVLPVFPAAFVEPDDKELLKADPVVRYSVFAAGPWMNIVWCAIFFAAILLIANPISAQITEPQGFTFDISEGDTPAHLAGLERLPVINYFQGERISTFNEISPKIFYGVDPGEVLNFGYVNDTSGALDIVSVVTTTHPDDESRAYVGIENIANYIVFTDGLDFWGPVLMWFFSLMRWIMIFNLAVGTINLVPMMITDGGQMFSLAVLSMTKNELKTAKIVNFVGLIFIAIILLGLATWFVGLF